MTSADSMILVINHTASAGTNLKELIEFMDMPRVCTAVPAEWRKKLGNHKLEALFVGPDLSDQEIESLLGEISKTDPDVPIVIMQDGDAE